MSTSTTPSRIPASRSARPSLKALGDKKGIARYADLHLPMDETLTRVALDISGRPFLVFRTTFPTEKIGAFDTELVREFFQAFAMNAGLTLHVETLYGENSPPHRRELLQGPGPGPAAGGRASIRARRDAFPRPRARCKLADASSDAQDRHDAPRHRPRSSVPRGTRHDDLYAPPAVRTRGRATRRLSTGRVLVQDGFSWGAFAVHVPVVLRSPPVARGARSCWLASRSLSVAFGLLNVHGAMAGVRDRVLLVDPDRPRGRQPAALDLRAGAACPARATWSPADDRDEAEAKAFARWLEPASRPRPPRPSRARRPAARPGRPPDGRSAAGARPVSRRGARAMSVAIVDYGSGNLHSAAKAFERAAREAGLDRHRHRSPPIPRPCAAADRIVLPGVGAFADCRRGLDAVPGMVEALTEAVRERRPAVPRHLRRHAAAGDARPRIRDHAGPRLDPRRRRRRSRPTDPALKIPHMGWNTLHPRPRPRRCSTASRPARTACTPISCIPTPSQPDDPADVVAHRPMADR